MFRPNSILINSNGLISNAYHNSKNKTAVIYCKGGPDFGDNGQTEIFSKVSADLGISVIIPDYFGSGRSTGNQFSIKSCVHSINQLEEVLLNNIEVLDCWNNNYFKFNIQKVVLMGHSWGGSIAALYPKFYEHSKINKIGLAAGALDYSSTSHDENGGESDEDFWQQIKNGWLEYYRNIEDSDWKDLILHRNKQHSPLNNVEPLLNKRILICHGRNDEIILHKRSEDFYNKLVENKMNPNLVILKIRDDKDHFGIINKELFKMINEL